MERKKVVHILGQLNPGGIEIWLKDILKESHNNSEYIHVFFLLSGAKGFYDKEFKKYGAKLLYAKSLNPFYISKQLKIEGEINILHCHIHFGSAYFLLIKKFFYLNIRKFIVHSHNDTKSMQSNSSWNRKIYFKVSRFIINKYSDSKLACSEYAGKALFKKSEFSIQPYCIDIDKFNNSSDKLRFNIKNEHGIPQKSKVIGHVGSFSKQKNHTFLISIFEQIYLEDNSSYLVLIGDGVDRQYVENIVKRKKMDNNVLFLGLRDDVDILMSNLFDMFLFPSLFEGLGIVLLEAQTSGLPILTSDIIPDEVRIVDSIYNTLSLSDDKKNWAIKSLEILSAKVDGVDGFSALKESIYTIKNSKLILEKYYDN